VRRRDAQITTITPDTGALQSGYFFARGPTLCIHG
jgi:hypothetical protein